MLILNSVGHSAKGIDQNSQTRLEEREDYTLEEVFLFIIPYDNIEMCENKVAVLPRPQHFS